jgi:glutamate-1-semialdehyde 2,1-aminomutase
MRRGQGCKIWDVDGNEYLDYVNNYGPLVLGTAIQRSWRPFGNS